MNTEKLFDENGFEGVRLAATEYGGWNLQHKYEFGCWTTVNYSENKTRIIEAAVKLHRKWMRKLEYNTKKYGILQCMNAYTQCRVDGEGGRTVGINLGVPTVTADAMINTYDIYLGKVGG